MEYTQSKTFPVGGIHPKDNKLSASTPIKKLPLPQTVTIPVSQHVGVPATPIVQANDKVKVGQRIAKAEGFVSANIHSSVSGTVIKIDDVMDISGYKKKSIIIQAKGDEWQEGIDLNQAIVKDISAEPLEIIEKIKNAGIVGLGGAIFPSHVKLMPLEGKKIEYLLINGVECEPYLTSDHRLMLERSEEIMVGVKILLKALQINKAFIGIEDNKPDAIEKLRALTGEYPEIEVVPLKVQYPQGGERQLVKAIINREIPPPPKGLPIDVGCVVFNVATTYAIYGAVQKNKPLVERVVSITGKMVKEPSNFLARIGTSIAYLFEAAGGLPEETGKVLGGGPMMSRALNTMDIPLTKGMSGIVAVSEKESKRKEVFNCIRCAKCVSICPLGLEPYLLMNATEKEKFDKAEERKVLSCCECGCCSYICPSNRPLLDYIKLGKSTVTNIQSSRK